MFCSIFLHVQSFLKLNLFLQYLKQGVKLVALNIPRYYLQLPSVASSPSYICITPSCTNLPLHMLDCARKLQWAWIWILVSDIPQGKISFKPTFKSLPRATLTSKRNIRRMKAQPQNSIATFLFFFFLVFFFFFFEEFVLFSLL